MCHAGGPRGHALEARENGRVTLPPCFVTERQKTKRYDRSNESRKI